MIWKLLWAGDFSRIRPTRDNKCNSLPVRKKWRKQKKTTKTTDQGSNQQLRFSTAGLREIRPLKDILLPHEEELSYGWQSKRMMSCSRKLVFQAETGTEEVVEFLTLKSWKQPRVVLIEIYRSAQNCSKKENLVSNGLPVVSAFLTRTSRVLCTHESILTRQGRIEKRHRKVHDNHNDDTRPLCTRASLEWRLGFPLAKTVWVKTAESCDINGKPK